MPIINPKVAVHVGSAADLIETLNASGVRESDGNEFTVLHGLEIREYSILGAALIGASRDIDRLVSTPGWLAAIAGAASKPPGTP